MVLFFTGSDHGRSQCATGGATTKDNDHPPGMTVETVTSTKCTTAGAIVTTMAAGSTTTEVVPRFCANGFALFLFGTPKIPQLCRTILRLLGSLMHFICNPQTDEISIGFDLISYPDDPEGLSDPNDPSNQGPSDPDDPNNSSNQDPRDTVSLLSQTGPSAFITSSLSSAVSSTVSSSASSALITGSFVGIFSDLITASVPIPNYATGIPGVGMGSLITVANGPLDGLSQRSL